MAVKLNLHFFLFCKVQIYTCSGKKNWLKNKGFQNKEFKKHGKNSTVYFVKSQKLSPSFVRFWHSLNFNINIVLRDINYLKWQMGSDTRFQAKVMFKFVIFLESVRKEDVFQW